VITLGVVAGGSVVAQVAVLAGVSVAMTIGVYGLVAGIVKLDDLGAALVVSGRPVAAGIGRGILAVAPWLMRGISVAGTAAMFVVGGGIIAHAVPAVHETVHERCPAACPDPGDTVVVDLHLDAFSLMASAGALARSDPVAALSLFEHDLLQNTPLATCIVPAEGGRAGKPALELELVLENGTAQHIVVAYGELVRIPVAPGTRGSLAIRRPGGSRVLRTLTRRDREAREEFIDGSVLGIIVDARLRPLLDVDDNDRRDALWHWLVALGAEQGELPYGATPITPGRQSAGEVVVGPGGASRGRDTASGEVPPPETPAAAARRRLGR